MARGFLAARLASALVGVSFVAACGKSLPPAFTQARSAAETAGARGDDASAAQHWARAAAVAPDRRERDEANYRRALSLEQTGAFAAADAVYAALERGNGERSARSAFARAALAERQGRSHDARRLRRAALLRFPNSGLARRAAAGLLAELELRAGPRAALDEAAELARQLRGTELEEALLYLHAARAERLGDADKALHGYVEILERFAYPFSDYRDEAALAAARLEERRGHYARAVALLERLLAERETSLVSGSYERAGYATARFRIAELYRDRLADPARAVREFRRVALDHPTTLLGDDALFEAALIARSMADADETCRTARELITRRPESRFARCASELCPSLQAHADCRDYVRRRIHSVPRRTVEDHSSSSSR